MNKCRKECMYKEEHKEYEREPVHGAVLKRASADHP